MKPTTIVTMLVVAILATTAVMLHKGCAGSPPPKDSHDITISRMNSKRTDDSGLADKQRMAKRMINAPLSFYGEAVDEEGSPVSEVVVHCWILRHRLNGLSLDPTPERERVMAVSSVTGRFSIEHQNGAQLSVERLAKPGYQFIGRPSDVFAYSMAGELHKPDPSKPVRFTLIRERSEPRLIERSHILRFQWDMQTKRYDVETGVLAEDGDFSITPRRKRFGEPGIYDFDWCVDLKMKDGGLVLIGDSPDFVAPPDGYRESISLGTGYSDRNLVSSSSAVWLFARSSGGKFYLLNLSIFPDRRSSAKSAGLLRVKWNEDGTRILGIPN